MDEVKAVKLFIELAKEGYVSSFGKVVKRSKTEKIIRATHLDEGQDVLIIALAGYNGKFVNPHYKTCSLCNEKVYGNFCQQCGNKI